MKYNMSYTVHSLFSALFLIEIHPNLFCGEIKKKYLLHVFFLG